MVHGPSSRLARALVALAAALSAHCTAAQHPDPAPTAHQVAAGGDTPAACTVAIDTPEGMQPVDDAALHGESIGAPNEGKLCASRTFEVTGHVRVYRVWNAAQAYTARGRWWTLTPPHGPREQYREANAVCAEWSALDRVSECDLVVGSHVALGPGQSARCEGGVTLPASPVLQLYVPNDTRATPPRLLVENCTEGAPWP